MRKIISILLILMSMIFLNVCSGNDPNNLNEVVKVSDPVSVSDTGDYKISKETLKALYVDLYGYEENIEYIITKEYIYSDNGELKDTTYTTDGIVYSYDENGDIASERPITEEDDKRYEYHNSSKYLADFERYIESFKDPENTVETYGEVTLDDTGRVIRDEVTSEDGTVYVSIYEYDEKGRVSKIINNDESYWSDTTEFIYDDQDRVIKVLWGGGELGYTETYFTYDDRGLLVKIFVQSRGDTMDGMDYTVLFEYIGM